jgi:hypothetical protein
MVLLICILRFSLYHALADSPSRHTINFLLAPPLDESTVGGGTAWRRLLLELLLDS